MIDQRTSNEAIYLDPRGFEVVCFDGFTIVYAKDLLVGLRPQDFFAIRHLQVLLAF